MSLYRELMGETDFEDRIFTGFSTADPNEIFEPRPCMEMMERRIQETMPETCWTCKKAHIKSKMLETRKALIFSGRLLPNRYYCSKKCMSYGEDSLQKQVTREEKICMNYRLSIRKFD